MKCPECKGSGDKSICYPNGQPWTGACPTCKGKGCIITPISDRKIGDEYCDESYKGCPTCHGTGEVEEMKDELRKAFEYSWPPPVFIEFYGGQYIYKGMRNTSETSNYTSMFNVWKSRQPEITALEERLNVQLAEYDVLNQEFKDELGNIIDDFTTVFIQFQVGSEDKGIEQLQKYLNIIKIRLAQLKGGE